MIDGQLGSIRVKKHSWRNSLLLALSQPDGTPADKTYGIHGVLSNVLHWH